MKALTRKMVEWFLPDHVLIVPDRKSIDALVKKHLPGVHLHGSPPKGRRKGEEGLRSMGPEINKEESQCQTN